MNGILRKRILETSSQPSNNMRSPGSSDEIKEFERRILLSDNIVLDGFLLKALLENLLQPWSNMDTPGSSEEKY